MPWRISKKGSMWAVVDKITGKTKSVFSSRQKASQYLKALYANYKKN